MEYREFVKRKISKEIANIILVCMIPATFILYTIDKLRNPAASELDNHCLFEQTVPHSHTSQSIESILNCIEPIPDNSSAQFLKDC